jgi:uncharacterized protein (TIGR00369 family)
MSPEAPGLERLRRLQLFEPREGMWANLGMRIASVDIGSAVVEGDFSRREHGDGASRGATIHRGAIAAIADGALACAGATLIGEGEVATTVELLVDFFHPARPGHVIARGRVRHRAGHLVYCAVTVEQDGTAVAEANATIALVRPA